jgi:transposase
MNKAAKGHIHLFFVDASHFVQGGFLGYVWVKVRTYIQTSSGRKRYNVLGALNFVTKKLETITNDEYITSAQVIALIDKLVENYAILPIKLVLDNASYQRCKLVTEYAAMKNVELVFLPSYSPNLNLIERVWKFVKSEVLNAAYYGTFEEFKKVINGCTSKLNTDYKSRIDTLITENVQLFKEEQIFRLVA